jgi:hypothetical protein
MEGCLAQVVEHYGFHLDGNLVFLLEQGPGQCLTPGLESMDSPFEVFRPDRLPCPHHLYKPAPGDVLDDPMVLAMAPVMSEGAVYHVHIRDASKLWALSKMIGGNQTKVFSPWAMYRPTAKLATQLSATNAAPMVVMNDVPKHYEMVNHLITLPRTRTLIVCGPIRFPGTEILPVYEGSLELDWPSIGAAMTERFVRQCLT